MTAHLWRSFRSVAKFLAGVLLGIGLAVGFWLLNSDDPVPEVFEDLPPISADIEPEVDRRMKAAFPAGIPETKLIAELSSWGFQFSERDGLLRANLFVNSFVCSQSFFVQWEADRHRRIVAVTGQHHLSCF